MSRPISRRIELVYETAGFERRIGGADIGDNLSGQPRSGDLIEPEQIGAQAIVDIMGVVGDVVGDGGDLRLHAREAPQLQVLHPGILQDRLGHAARAVALERRSVPRSVSGPLCLTRPSSVSQVRLSPSNAG